MMQSTLQRGDRQMGIVAKRLRNGLWLGVLLAGMLGAVPVARQP